MKRNILAAMAATMLLANTSWAQVDLGGAIQGAINGATGNAQAPTITNAQAPNAAPPKAAVNGAGTAAASATSGTSAAVNPPPIPTPGGAPSAPGVSANAATGANISGSAAGATNATGVGAGSVNQNAGQGWLGRVGNDIRGALQQADNGIMRLQDNLNPSLQQYGFRPGDQILDANGQPLTQAQFDQYVQNNPGQVRVLRNGQTIVLNGNMQGNIQGNMQGRGQAYGQGQMSGQGMMQPSGRQRFGITMNPSGEGVMVSAVTVGSPAAQAGIRPGDQIISVNGQEVANPNAMIQLVGNSSADQPLDVRFRRNGQEMQSQVMLASSMNSQQGVYQAGYAQGMDNRGGNQGAGGQGHADINARIDQLERMVQDLRDQVEQLTKADDK